MMLREVHGGLVDEVKYRYVNLLWQYIVREHWLE